MHPANSHRSRTERGNKKYTRTHGGAELRHPAVLYSRPAGDIQLCFSSRNADLHVGVVAGDRGLSSSSITDL